MYCEEIYFLDPRISGVVETGSRVICRPPVMDTDQDFFVYVHPEDRVALVEKLLETGWAGYGKYVTSGEENDKWSSFRRGDVNLVLTWSRAIFDSCKLATHVAKALNLTHKQDRRDLFETIRQLAIHYKGGHPSEAYFQPGVEMVTF